MIRISVDGSWSANNPDVVGWAYISDDESLIGMDSLANHENLRQVLGEMKAAMKAVHAATHACYKTIIIAYDYDGVEKWVTDKWKAKTKYTQQYRDWMRNRITRGYDIRFEKIDAATNPADVLARSQTGAKDRH